MEGVDGGDTIGGREISPDFTVVYVRAVEVRLTNHQREHMLHTKIYNVDHSVIHGLINRWKFYPGRFMFNSDDIGLNIFFDLILSVNRYYLKSEMQFRNYDKNDKSRVTVMFCFINFQCKQKNFN